MDSLRVTLILIGLAILAAIWLLHKPNGRGRKPGAVRRDPVRRSEREPALEAEDADPIDGEPADDERSSEPRQTQLPDMGSEAPDWSVESARQTEAQRLRSAAEPTMDAGAAGASEDAAVREDRREPRLDAPAPPTRDARIEPRWPGDEPEDAPSADQPRERMSMTPETGEAPRIVTLYVRARGERLISGLSLLDSAIKAGLRFGEMKIFHRRHQGASRPVFSMANITRPGSFDPSAWNLFETPGVTLFMTLPGPVSGLDAWDAMLATGQRLSELLDADLMDDSQCLLTRQRIAQIREEMREHDRKAGLDG